MKRKETIERVEKILKIMPYTKPRTSKASEGQSLTPLLLVSLAADEIELSQFFSLALKTCESNAVVRLVFQRTFMYR